MQPQSLALSRTAIGLLQGIVLYFLYTAYETKSWPATDGPIFAALLAPATYVPLMLVAALGHLRPRTLVPWILVALAVSAGLAFYDIVRDPVLPGTSAVRILPNGGFWLALATALFITHSLIAAGESDRRIVAKYETYFDVSWKLAVQLVLASVFVGAMWLLLWLGAELFRLIKIEFLAELIKKRWFWIPVTTLAISYALHVTDVRAVLVQGVRNLKLTLLSWLLPIMAGLAVAFVLALPFTGLEVLWNTRRATSILLTSVAALVFLINAAYQDGQTGAIPRLLSYARVVAAIVIVPLVALAGYGLFLRVVQYGWTPQRVVACACVVVAIGYAAGYLLAAVRAPLVMKGLERTNVARGVRHRGSGREPVLAARRSGADFRCRSTEPLAERRYSARTLRLQLPALRFRPVWPRCARAAGGDAPTDRRVRSIAQRAKEATADCKNRLASDS